MEYLAGCFTKNGDIDWTRGPGHPCDSEEGLCIQFAFFSAMNRRDALKSVAAGLKQNNITWLRPVGSPTREWVVDGVCVAMERKPGKCMLHILVIGIPERTQTTLRHGL